MYKDESSDPPELVCQVGSTTLTYQFRAIEDLHRWLLEQGDQVVLGAADEAAITDDSACTFRRCLKPLVSQRTHDARNNRMRAR